jgi:hypothetical protein
MEALVEEALGMILIFLFTSLIVTAIQEIVASFFGLRAKSLEGALKAILDGTESNVLKAIFASLKAIFVSSDANANPQFKAFSSNPLIKALRDANGSKPSYIPSRSFALAVMQIGSAAVARLGAGAGAGAAKTAFDAIKNWAGTDGSPIANIVNSLITDATDTEEKLQKSIESWFDETMDRLTGWYKRWTQVTTIVFGLAAAVFFNIDSIAVWGALSSQPQLRAASASYASTISKSDKPPTYNDMLKEFDALKLPVGWPPKDAKNTTDSFWDWALKSKMVLSKDGKDWDGWVLFLAILGWVITALAASLGSAFWFDMLKQFVQIRSAGPKPLVTETGAHAPAAASRPAPARDRA